MDDNTMDCAAAGSLETVLRDELAREDRALCSVAPVLRHLLVSEGQSLVSDAIVARVRGMMGDLAAQLLAGAKGRDPALRGGGSIALTEIDRMAEALVEDPALLGFCHALACEGQLLERLEHRASIDPVLSPLMQELIASEDPRVAELAMAVLTAQSRFLQTQRRMELPLGELPADILDQVLRGFGQVQRNANGDQLARLAGMRSDYDEAAGRIGLLSRLVAAMRRGAVACLMLDHAGLSLFASGLAGLARMRRDTALLSIQSGQGARLALAMRSAGASAATIKQAFLLAHPSGRLPRGLDTVPAEHARDLLAAGLAGPA